MSKTLIGFRHHVVAVVLTTLMAIIGVLFVADMATRKDERREHSKLVDVGVCCVWLAIVGFLVMNSLRLGGFASVSRIGSYLIIIFERLLCIIMGKSHFLTKFVTSINPATTILT